MLKLTIYYDSDHNMELREQKDAEAKEWYQGRDDDVRPVPMTTIWPDAELEVVMLEDVRRGGGIAESILRKTLTRVHELEKENRRLDADNALRRAKANGEYWAWQGGGADYLESLVCPVLIPAKTLLAMERSLAELEAERDRLQAQVNNLIRKMP